MVAIAWKRSKHGFSFTDADSGYKVSCFERQRGRKKKYVETVCWKKDVKGRFKKDGQVNSFILQYIGILDACYENEKRSNSLHIECYKYENIDIDKNIGIDFLKDFVEETAEKLKSICFSPEMTECFDYFAISDDNPRFSEEVQFRLKRGDDICTWDRCR